jgi:hypothetical protein
MTNNISINIVRNVSVKRIGQSFYILGFFSERFHYKVLVIHHYNSQSHVIHVLLINLKLTAKKSKQINIIHVSLSKLSKKYILTNMPRNVFEYKNGTIDAGNLNIKRNIT